MTVDTVKELGTAMISNVATVNNRTGPDPVPGNNSTSENTLVEEGGACCLYDQQCIEDVLAATCTALGDMHPSTFLGRGSVCLGDSDNDGIDDQCDRCPGVDDHVFGFSVCEDTGEPCTVWEAGGGTHPPQWISNCPGGDPELCLSQCQVAIPTMSEWGLIVLTLLLLAVAKVYFGRRRAPVG